MDEKKPWYIRQLELIFQSFFTIGASLAVVQSWEKFHSVGFSLFAGIGNWSLTGRRAD